eukprot:evm.model.scf_319EXC.3 EVM.evm.TU.scf_319EXC.3   scf_319EXC:13222-17022(+)
MAANGASAPPTGAADAPYGLTFGIRRLARPGPPPPLDAQPPQRQYVTALSDSKIIKAQPSSDDDEDADPEVRVIAAQPNRPFLPSFLPLADAKAGDVAERFEAAAPDQSAGEVKYGLQAREERSEPRESAADREDRAFRADMASLPEEAPLEAYDAMPVEDFGKALLRGMGWVEGGVVGRDKEKEAPAAVALVPRAGRLGLGAKPAPELAPGKGKKRNRRGDMVPAPSADGRERNTRSLDEKLVSRTDLGPEGKTMEIVEGKHSGLICRVLKVLEKEKGQSERASVQLLSSDQVVTVHMKDLAPRRQRGKGDQSGASAKPARHANNRAAFSDAAGPGDAGDRSASSRRGKWAKDEEVEVGVVGVQEESGRRGATRLDAGNEGHHRQGRGAPRHPATQSDSDDDIPKDTRSHPPWVMSGIRVRIIDKRLHGGRLYLKKGSVVDVLAPGLADVLMDGSREVVTEVRESSLETVVPRREGSIVVVVAGRLRGSRGRLLDRSAASGMAAVQMVGDLSVERLSLDAVAEWVEGVDE